MRTLIYLIAFAGLLGSAPLQALDHTHAKLERVLKTYVNEKGEVNYKALKKNTSDLEAYLKDVASVTREDIAAWTREQKIAYWMNVYNAYTLETILEHLPLQRAKGFKYRLYPENSIRQIPGVWDKRSHRAGGKNVTLSEIENAILRDTLQEPRIHFTIVCASVGCPVLRNQAYRAEALEEQLEQATRVFVQNPEKNRLDRTAGKLYLSKIFKWYTADFDDSKGASGYRSLDGVVSLVMAYASEEDRAYLKMNKVKIAWLEYDWSLNEQ